MKRMKYDREFKMAVKLVQLGEKQMKEIAEKI